MLGPVGIPDKELAQNAIGFTWGTGNHITAFPATFLPVDKPDKQTNVHPTKLHFIKWETTIYNQYIRKLVNESCGTFTALQNLNQQENNMSNSDLLKLSHQYRSIINVCIEDLSQAADAANGKECKDLQHLHEVFYKTELLWNACEVMYLEKPTGVLPHLVEWVQVHFPAAKEMAVEVLECSPPASHENYWKALYGLTLQLRIESARKLLRVHHDYQSESFQSADELLRKMPIFGANSSISVPEFTFRWKHWRDECESRLQSRDFYENQDLEKLVQILCGKDVAFDELNELFETWYQRMVCQLLFTQPTINANLLADQVESFITAFRGHENLTLFDSAIIAVLQKDTQKVIGEMQTVLDNTWFSAHLVDLLHHAGALDSLEDGSSSHLRETLLRDYAICLFSHPSLWTVGALYLNHCPISGPATLEILLTRLPCNSEYKAAKILAVAEQCQLPSVSTTICRVFGRRALANGRLGAAVAWAVRAQDTLLATYAADAVLKDYLENSHFTSIDLLDSLGSGLLASERLAFLGKYREFHRLYNKNELRSAATLLVSLISSRIAPKYFWSVLLMDALPLLETSPPVFSLNETYELMQSLQELTSSFRNETEDNVHSNCDLNEDKVMLITLALSRNLAKCFVQQTTPS